MGDKFPPDGDSNSYSGFVLKSISKAYSNLVVDYRVTELFGGESLPCTSEVRGTLISVEFQENSQLTTVQDHAFLDCKALTKLDFSSCSKLTKIKDYAFSGCSAASSIILPSSSLSLGQYAFHCCSNLASIFIPRTVTSVGFACFCSCSKLPTITFETNSSVTYLNKWIGIGSGITSFCIPASVTGMASGTFEAASKLSTITIEEDNKFFKMYNEAVITTNGEQIVAFPPVRKCEFEFPDTITSIYTLAFAFNQITKLSLSNKLDKIPSYAFRNSVNLEEVTIPNSVCSIDGYAFYQSGNLKIVTISSGCTSIGGYAFYQCPISEIVIPEGVKSIGDSCFENCGQLVKIILPSTLTSLGGKVFPNRADLNISFGSGANMKIDEDRIVMNLDETIISQFMGVQSNFNPTIRSSIVTIKANAFSSRSNIVSVSFNDDSSLTAIERNAFYRCNNLSSFVFPKSLISIGSEAFLGCVKLTKLEFKQSLSTIENYAFSGCSGVNEIQLGDSPISQINQYAFQSCSSLTTVVLPASIAYFDEYCFSQCTKLEQLTIPSTAKITAICDYAFYNTSISSFSISQDSSVSSIGEHAFSYCTKLTSFTFVPSIKTIDTYAFSYSGLTEVHLSNSISHLNDRCFYGCSSVKTFIIPENSELFVEGLGSGIFGFCKSLSKIECSSSNFKVIIGALFTNDGKNLLIFPPASDISSLPIPESVDKISNGAFLGCSNIYSVIIPFNSVRFIGVSAFEDCINLHYINIPKNVTTVAQDAFKGCKNLKCGVDIENKDSKYINDIINNAKLPKVALLKCSAKVTCKNNRYQSVSKTSVSVIISLMIGSN